jgi:hypothetical protein
VCERFIVPTLSADDLAAFARGEQRLQPGLRELVSRGIGYRAITTKTGEDARAVEDHVLRFGLALAGWPLLQPRP